MARSELNVSGTVVEFIKLFMNIQLKTTEKNYKLLYLFESLFLYSNIINQCGSGSTGSVEVMFFSCV